MVLISESKTDSDRSAVWRRTCLYMGLRSGLRHINTGHMGCQTDSSFLKVEKVWIKVEKVFIKMVNFFTHLEAGRPAECSEMRISYSREKGKNKSGKNRLFGMFHAIMLK